MTTVPTAEASVPATQPGTGHPTSSPAPAGAFGFPVFVEVRDRVVLVAGGGHEPATRATQLASLGARVRLWAPEHRQTAGLADTPGVEMVAGEYDAGVLFQDALLALVATGDRQLDRAIAADARARRVLVNTVDDIPACDWSAPAVLRRGDLTIAVATGGVAPALAVRLRDRMADDIGPEYGDLLELFADLRPSIMATGRPFRDRRALWYDLVDGGALEHLRAGDRTGARAELHRQLDAWLDAP